MKQAGKWKPDWVKIKEDYDYRLFQIERDKLKLEDRINSAMKDGRWDKKTEEFTEFWNNAELYFDRFREVLSVLSGQMICRYAPPSLPFTKVELFDSIELSATPFTIEDNTRLGIIDIKPLGSIYFIAEQDYSNFHQEFNLFVSRYGLNHHLGDRTRSKRCAHEMNLITTKENSEWTPQILDYSEIEISVGKSILALKDAIPYYRNSDIQFK